MAHLIGILLGIGVIIGVLYLVGILVAFVVKALVFVALIVTLPVVLPAFAVLGLIQSLEVTERWVIEWCIKLLVVLYALLGGVIGFSAHRIFQPLQKFRQRPPEKATSAVDRPGGASFLQSVRQRPLRETVAEIWANRTHRFIAIAILVLLVLMAC